MNPRTTALTFRVIGAFAVVVTVACLFFILQGMPFELPTLLKAAIVLIFVGCLALMLFGIAAALDRSVDLSTEFSRSMGRMQEQIGLMMERIDQMSIDRPSTPGADPQLHTELARVRDLLLLNEGQRQKIADDHKRQQARETLNEAALLIEQRQWIEADRLIADVESALPTFEPAIALRRRFVQSHTAAETEAYSSAVAEIESAMSRSDWTDAAARASNLAATYPQNAEAITLSQRVAREHAIYNETTATRLFDEIRHASERKQWRRALGSAQELLSKCPSHERSERIRQQLHALQENAEIEERHEIEHRISDLVRSRRYEEAVTQAEELLQRFPMSPQADAMTKLLPILREKAAEESRA